MNDFKPVLRTNPRTLRASGDLQAYEEQHVFCPGGGLGCLWFLANSDQESLIMLGLDRE